MDFNIIYEDSDILVVDKPAGISVFPEGTITEKTLIDYLVEKKPELKGVGEAPRYGVVHRLDKDTSGVFLVAKTAEALNFLQKQFINRNVVKRYITLATGAVKPDKSQRHFDGPVTISPEASLVGEDTGEISARLGRSPADPRKQKAYKEGEYTPEAAREALTKWKVLERFENYTLLEVEIVTGRRHQIRAHLAFIHHPVAGDKVYGFKDSPCPEGLERQFLHAKYIKIALLNGQIKEFTSALPKDLSTMLEHLRSNI